MTNAESILDRGINYAFEEYEKRGQDLSKLAVPLQTVVLITHAQGMVDNGGFRYFFEGDMPGNPSYKIFSDAYRRIGALKVADSLDLATDLFPFENPHLSTDKRNEYMDSLEESDQLFAMGDEVCGDETIWQNLEKYIADHASVFSLPNA